MFSIGNRAEHIWTTEKSLAEIAPIQVVSASHNQWSLIEVGPFVISILALIFSVLSWRSQGPLPKFRVNVYGTAPSDAFIQIVLVNHGRLPAMPGSLEVCTTDGTFRPVDSGDFVAFYEEDAR